MIFLITIFNYIFSTYTILLMIRIFGSWIPPLQNTKFMHFIAFYTDPYLNIFKRIIPPIGGTLDISPLVAFFVLYIVKSLVIRLLYALFM